MLRAGEGEPGEQTAQGEEQACQREKRGLRGPASPWKRIRFRRRDRTGTIHVCPAGRGGQCPEGVTTPPAARPSQARRAAAARTDLESRQQGWLLRFARLPPHEGGFGAPAPPILRGFSTRSDVGSHAMFMATGCRGCALRADARRRCGVNEARSSDPWAEEEPPPLRTRLPGLDGAQASPGRRAGRGDSGGAAAGIVERAKGGRDLEKRSRSSAALPQDPLSSPTAPCCRRESRARGARQASPRSASTSLYGWVTSTPSFCHACWAASVSPRAGRR
jgi:hypothetical protein